MTRHPPFFIGQVQRGTSQTLSRAHHWKLEVAEGRMTTGRHRIQVQVKEPGETAEIV